MIMTLNIGSILAQNNNDISIDFLLNNLDSIKNPTKISCENQKKLNEKINAFFQEQANLEQADILPHTLQIKGQFAFTK